MSQNKSPFMAKIMPFLALGVFVVLCVIAVIISFYVLLWGAIIGAVVFVVAWLKSKFCPAKKQPKDGEHQGRTIDHDKL